MLVDSLMIGEIGPTFPRGGEVGPESYRTSISGLCVDPYAALLDNSDDVLGIFDRGGVVPLDLGGVLPLVRGGDVPLERGGVLSSSRWCC